MRFSNRNFVRFSIEKQTFKKIKIAEFHVKVSNLKLKHPIRSDRNSCCTTVVE